MYNDNKKSNAVRNILIGLGVGLFVLIGGIIVMLSISAPRKIEMEETDFDFEEREYHYYYDSKKDQNFKIKDDETMSLATVKYGKIIFEKNDLNGKKLLNRNFDLSGEFGVFEPKKVIIDDNQDRVYVILLEEKIENSSKVINKFFLQIDIDGNKNYKSIDYHTEIIDVISYDNNVYTVERRLDLDRVNDREEEVDVLYLVERNHSLEIEREIKIVGESEEDRKDYDGYRDIDIDVFTKITNLKIKTIENNIYLISATEIQKINRNLETEYILNIGEDWCNNSIDNVQFAGDEIIVFSVEISCLNFFDIPFSKEKIYTVHKYDANTGDLKSEKEVFYRIKLSEPSIVEIWFLDGNIYELLNIDGRYYIRVLNSDYELIDDGRLKELDGWWGNKDVKFIDDKFYAVDFNKEVIFRINLLEDFDVK